MSVEDKAAAINKTFAELMEERYVYGGGKLLFPSIHKSKLSVTVFGLTVYVNWFRKGGKRFDWRWN